MQTFRILVSSLDEENQWIVDAQMNPRKFEPLYRKYYSKIFAYINRRTQNKDLTNDITSQVFTNAIQRIGSYKNQGYSFGSWLYRIAHNEICQEFRNEKKQKFTDLEEKHLQLMQNTEDYFEKEARILDLESALTKMKKNYFQIIQMRYFDNLSFKEIALKLHISENTAKVRCFRAIEKLKDIYTLI